MHSRFMMVDRECGPPSSLGLVETCDPVQILYLLGRPVGDISDDANATLRASDRPKATEHRELPDFGEDFRDVHSVMSVF